MENLGREGNTNKLERLLTNIITSVYNDVKKIIKNTGSQTQTFKLNQKVR